MAKLDSNAAPKLYAFRLTYEDDGAVEIVTVKAESRDAALFLLPRSADVGRYRYEPVKREPKRGKGGGRS